MSFHQDRARAAHVWAFWNPDSNSCDYMCDREHKLRHGTGRYLQVPPLPPVLLEDWKDEEAATKLNAGFIKSWQSDSAPPCNHPNESIREVVRCCLLPTLGPSWPESQARVSPPVPSTDLTGAIHSLALGEARQLCEGSELSTPCLAT